jgi:hypothetical protein
MKISYLISGHPKTYDECVSSFLENVYSENVNVYSHFWWDESYKNKCWKLHFSETLGDIDLSKDILEKFGVKKYFTEKSRNFDITFFENFNKNTWGDNSDFFYKIMTPMFLHGMLSQTYSIYQALLLSESYNHDVIVKSRPDILITKNIIPIIQNLDLSDNNIYFQSSMGGGHLYAGEFPDKPCDWFFVASPKAMKIFLREWHNSISNFREGIMHTNELVKHVSSICGFNIHLVDFGALVYKQATNYYEKYHNKFDTYLSDFDFSEFRIKTPSIWPDWTSDINFQHFKNIKFSNG